MTVPRAESDVETTEPAPSPSPRLLSWLGRALGVALAAWVGLSVACIPLITLGTDEAWVLNGMRCWLGPLRPDLTSPAIFTSGGLHTLANVSIEWAWGNRVWVHRLFSWACLMVLVGLVARRGRSAGGSAAAGLVAVSPLVGLPGLAENGTAALGMSAAVLLLFVATWAWGRRQSDGLGPIVAGGLLYGLAAATRAELVLAPAAVVLAGCVAARRGGGWRFRAPIPELGVALIAGAVFAGNLLAHRAVSPGGEYEARLETNLGAAGMVGASTLSGPNVLARLVDYPRLLNKVRLAQQFAPLPLLALASLVPFALARDRRSEGLVRPTALFVAIGWTLWSGWVLRAPIPHLRYLTPALACFAIAGGLGLARLYGWAWQAGREWARAGLLILALAQVAGGVGPTFRSVVQGEHDLQSFEWAGQRPLDYFRRFQHVRDQRDAIAWMRGHIPEGSLVVVPTQLYVFRYLLDRPIVHTQDYDPDVHRRRGPAYLVFSPTIRFVSPEAATWIERNARLAGEIGRFSVYEVRGPLPRDLRDWEWSYNHHPLSRYWFGTQPPAVTRPPEPARRSARAGSTGRLG